MLDERPAAPGEIKPVGPHGHRQRARARHPGRDIDFEDIGRARTIDDEIGAKQIP
jgi:hypothetical protein